MKIVVEFASETLELQVEDEKLLGTWSGPAGMAADQIPSAIESALNSPKNCPPLRQFVVPGDKIALTFSGDLPYSESTLGAVVDTLNSIGVESIHSLKIGPGPARNPDGTTPVTHDPDDRNQLAYLANTVTEKRIYLNRALTDADCVIAVGTLGFDDALGFRGPWSTIYPGLTERESIPKYQPDREWIPPDPEIPNAALVESGEVTWLLGSQFHVGVLPGAAGLVEIVSGLEGTVRAEGAQAIFDRWTFRTAERADLVVAGIGRAGVSTSLEMLAEGLRTAMSLVRNGGKIVALSRANGPIGPCLKRLAGIDDPRRAKAVLKGREADHDYDVAATLAKVGAWADIYLLSELPAETVEDWSIIPLGKPEEAKRLVASAPSVIALSHADRTVAIVAEDYV